VRGAERRRHHHARLQPRGAAPVCLQLRVQLPAAAEAESLPLRDRGGGEAAAHEGRLAAALSVLARAARARRTAATSTAPSSAPAVLATTSDTVAKRVGRKSCTPSMMPLVTRPASVADHTR